ncbi:hypothetical protein TIFTF001_020234 [Ficus carica]|uniref:WPP domain-associated protein n=1 Tax=Ficus carica TaxID=3494 RepID=A0AA88A883_FICCA|nr:hypothetical protein TIFTF001_020234 [Ficus carica]
MAEARILQFASPEPKYHNVLLNEDRLLRRIGHCSLTIFIGQLEKIKILLHFQPLQLLLVLISVYSIHKSHLQVGLQISHFLIESRNRMDEFFGGTDGRHRISITDSTMMKIVHCTINKAHEKVKSKEGVIERLNEISKFYELAVVQLEGCMKFVQEETECYFLESSHEEEVLAGLEEIRDRLQGRLNESEKAITEKDRELTERLAGELKLRQALELKERELVSLRATVETTKTEDVEDRNGESCELMNSVDQQVWNIRQKLEPDNNKFRDQGGVDNEKVDQMGSDIDVLKETLDVAFGKMRNAIFLSEVAPIEQQWRWGVEKDTFSVLLRGLMWDFQEMFEEKMLRQERRVPVEFGELWSDLMEEVAGLKSELSSLFGQHEAMRVKIDDLLIQEKLKSGELLGEDGEEDGNHFVAKMIKSHESLIRKKSAEAEELNLLRRETAREKAFSSCRREKEPVSVKKRVQEVIVKLGNLMEWNEKLGKTFDDHREINGEENLSRKRLENSNATDREELDLNTLADAWESMDKGSCAMNEEVPNNVRRLEQEVEELNLKTKIMEENYMTLLEGLSKELNVKLNSFELERQTWEGKCIDLAAEMTNRWNEKIETNNVESRIREKIFFVVFNEAVKDCLSLFDSKSAELNDVRDDMHRIVFREMLNEWNKSIEDYDIHVLVRDMICHIVYVETIKSIVDTTSFEFRQCEEEKLAENSVKEDVCMVFIAETIKEWKTVLDAHNAESLFKEEIYQFVIFEAAKDACVAFVEADGREKFSGCLYCDNKIQETKHLSAEETTMRKTDSLPKCLEVEEHLTVSTCSKIRRYDANLDLVGLECEGFEKRKTSRSVSFKQEKALKHLPTNKETLNEVVSSLGVEFGDPDRVHHQGTPSKQDTEFSICKPKRNGKTELEPSDSLVIPVLEFFRGMLDFESRIVEKIQINSSRYFTSP